MDSQAIALLDESINIAAKIIIFTLIIFNLGIVVLPIDKFDLQYTLDCPAMMRYSKTAFFA